MVARQIGVFGSSTTEDENILALGNTVGELLAEKKVTVFCGGTTGVLGAVLQGAQKTTTVVIAPTDKKQDADCDVYIASSLNWFSRGPSLVNSLDGIIVIGGGVGTLTEVAYAWWQEIPIVVLETRGPTDKFIGKGFDERKSHVVLGAKTPEEVIEKLFTELNTKSQ